MHIFNKKMLLNYNAERLFTLISDIKNYPNFIPWCSGLRILNDEKDKKIAEVLIDAYGIHETYISDITFHPIKNNQGSVLITSDNGPFKELYSNWTILKITDIESEINFEINFHLKSKILDLMIKPFFGSACNEIVNAFQKRAKELLNV